MANVYPPGMAPSTGRSPPGEAPPPPPASLNATPPGLAPTMWQTPPAPTAAGGGSGPAAAGECREAQELQKEISGTIEAQVQRLIEQARQDTELKVKTELKTIHVTMMQIDAGLDGLLAQLDGMEPQEPAGQAMDADAVGLQLSKIEQQWGQEIRTLKQELHQTILAHNHNADLIKHHKDTIDAYGERCLKMQSSNAKTSEIQQQLQKLDARLKQQQKQRKLEPLFERLIILEQRVASATAVPWRYPGLPPLGVPPGIAGPPGIPPGMMPGMATTAMAQTQILASMKGSKGSVNTTKTAGKSGGLAPQNHDEDVATTGDAEAAGSGVMDSTDD